VHVSVNFNEMPDCPFCKRLRPVIESVCRRLGIPMIRREVNVAPRIFGDDQLRHVFFEENLKRIAPEVWKLSENNPIAKAFLKTHERSVHTPVVVIEAFPERGPALRLTIWGAPPEEALPDYERNLEAVLRALKNSEVI